MTADEGRAVMAYLAAAYPRTTLTGQTVAVYVSALEDLDGRDVQAGAREFVRRGRWMPTVSELREEADEARRVRHAAETAGRVLLALPEQVAPDEAAEARAATWRERIRRDLAKVTARMAVLQRGRRAQ